MPPLHNKKQSAPPPPPPPILTQPAPILQPSQIKRLQTKPQITINIPQYNMGIPSPYLATGPPGTHSIPTSAGGVHPPPNWPPYANPFNAMYSGGNFMFKQFEGIKDFTMASAKSGLNVGEKSAFYIYEKFGKWSKKWFTHIFLFLVIFLYSIAGASLFVAIEGQTTYIYKHINIFFILNLNIYIL